MDFFGMGIGEILLVIIIALVIWGPGKIPEIASTLGRTVRALRKATYDLTTTVTKELNVEEKDHLSQSRTTKADKTDEPDAGKIASDSTETTSPKD